MALLPSMLTITKLTGLASIAKEIKELFIGKEPVCSKRELAGKGVRDTTKFNSYHIAMIKAEFAMMQINNKTNPKKRMTQEELAIMLNKKLGLNKSRKSYAKIWNQE
jgi:electron transfer flavoprotein alpha subunit